MKGVILVDKESGKTSRDMVNELNHIFDMKKIGHTGTLDPIATGILVMCLGRYTKLVDMLSGLKKEYIAKIKFGISTDTLDITGNVLKKEKVKLNKDDIINTLNSLKGTFEQEIPIYSAKKINGKKLYEYARENKPVDLPVNNVQIFDIELMDINEDEITFRALVSKGTYIRSLINEICKRLNIIGTMSYLRRTKQGDFSIDDAFTIKQIKNGEYKLLTLKDLFNYPIYNLNEEEFHKAINGNKLVINSNSENIIVMYENKEIAIYQKEENSYIMKIMIYESIDF